MKRYIRVNQTETTPLDGDWIVFHTSRFTVTTLNELGGYCWTLLDDEQTAQTLRDLVHVQYGLTTALSVEDVECFLTELSECGLVERAG